MGVSARCILASNIASLSHQILLRLEDRHGLDGGDSVVPERVKLAFLVGHALSEATGKKAKRPKKKR